MTFRAMMLSFFFFLFALSGIDRGIFSSKSWGGLGGFVSLSLFLRFFRRLDDFKE